MKGFSSFPQGYRDAESPARGADQLAVSQGRLVTARQANRGSQRPPESLRREFPGCAFYAFSENKIPTMIERLDPKKTLPI